MKEVLLSIIVVRKVVLWNIFRVISKKIHFG